MSSKPSYPSEETDSRILRGYCGSRKFTIRPKLYLGPGPVPRMSCAEDEWSMAGVSRGAAEDYPVLGTPRLQREDQRLGEGYPQTALWRRCEWNKVHMEVRCVLGSRKICPLHIKCIGQHPDHVNEKRRLDGVTLILATKQKSKKRQLMGQVQKQALAWPTNGRTGSTKRDYIMKRLVRQKGGLRKMAKNLSLPAHLQEKDSRGEDNLTMYEHHEKPTTWWPRPSLSNPRSTNDIVGAFLRANPTLLTVRYESWPHNYQN